jgi:hypothetical protein
MAASFTACTSAAFQAPTAAPGQIIMFCAADTFGNHSTVLRSCCDENNGTLSSSASGCNLYCDVSMAQFNSTQSCMETNHAPTFCGFNNMTGLSSPSMSPSSTNSAPLPTHSGSTRRFAPGVFLIGMVVLLAISVI